VQLGLKLFSINQPYVLEALKLYEAQVFDYIELYAYPQSFKETIGFWKDLPIPFIIHAPHFGHGMNLACKEKKYSNQQLAHEAFLFADKLKAPWVVFHPGVEGNQEETIRQIQGIFDSRILIENKPYYSTDKKYVCRGWGVEELQAICQTTKTGFCLDFGHAICAANSKKEDVLLFLQKLLALKPALYHLTDGHFKGETDTHLHFEQGDYPIAKLFSFIPQKSFITNEATKDYPDSLKDFQQDMYYLKKLLEF